MVNLRNYTTSKERKAALEKHLSLHLPHIGSFSLDEAVAGTRNCENMVGVIQIPVGIAGPLEIQTDSKFETYIPLATTEGALVASVNRGTKAITLSGGVRIISQKIGITRAPVFKVKDIFHASTLITFVEQNFQEIKKLTENTSSHLKLLEIKPWTAGKSVYLRFRFDSGNAMGMNMATIAISHAIPFIEDKTDSKCIALSGNMCVDKKPNFLNFIEGRGFKVMADAVIPEKIIQEILKTDADSILEVYNRKIVTGSILSGSIGANAHFSNILSAVFLATGQDIAHIVESSMGITIIEKEDHDLYISVTLPDLPVGVVGGGTQLETQKEALSIMDLGIKENYKSQRLAEIIVGAVLAGELSLLASLAQNSLACAHKTLGRGKTK